ncbi:hypothetical protein [Paenibacillus sp. GCM10027626]|uniref:hypothetical protein n=1 Tax=Paenibacillus sp. GCM10027626 TaxID=3273411 RepID=UPI00362538E6
MKNLKQMKWVVLLVLAAMLTACGGGSSASEKTALSYVNDFLNEKDVDKKKKYVEDHVVEEAKPLLLMVAAAPMPENDQYKNAKAVETVDFNEDGQKGSLVLIQADDAKEVAVLIVDGKVMIGFGNKSNGEDNAQFAEIRKKFKAALPK